MRSRRSVLRSLVSLAAVPLAGCSFSGEHSDFEADNRTDERERVDVAWDGRQEAFDLAAGESASRRDLLPDGETTVVVEVGDRTRRQEWTGDGTLYVDIESDGVTVGTYYDD